jgi:hypothetical protein
MLRQNLHSTIVTGDEIFEIFADFQSISLDLTKYPDEDIAIIYVGEHNDRYILLVWGYGWQGTYAASSYLFESFRQYYCFRYHMFMLRWVDLNLDGKVQQFEISIASYT